MIFTSIVWRNIQHTSIKKICFKFLCVKTKLAKLIFILKQICLYALIKNINKIWPLPHYFYSLQKKTIAQNNFVWFWAKKIRSRISQVTLECNSWVLGIPYSLAKCSSCGRNRAGDPLSALERGQSTWAEAKVIFHWALCREQSRFCKGSFRRKRSESWLPRVLYPNCGAEVSFHKSWAFSGNSLSRSCGERRCMTRAETRGQCGVARKKRTDQLSRSRRESISYLLRIKYFSIFTRARFY